MGEVVDQGDLPLYITKSLDQNAHITEYADTIGQKQFNAYVGFVDLVGYSERTTNLSPTGVRDFLVPFLEGVIDECTSCWCLVDKTIGDEVMFILPDPEEESLPPADVGILNLMHGLCNLYFAFERFYRFRIGVTHGEILVDSIGNARYRELAAFGTTIGVAKRLMAVNELSNPDMPMCALGTAVSGPATSRDAIAALARNLSIVPEGWRKVADGERDMKGVGAGLAALHEWSGFRRALDAVFAQTHAEAQGYVARSRFLQQQREAGAELGELIALAVTNLPAPASSIENFIAVYSRFLDSRHVYSLIQDDQNTRIIVASLSRERITRIPSRRVVRAAERSR